MGLVDVERARAFVPPDLDIVELRPGRTLAAFAIADYQHRATFPYGELSVMAAVVRCRGVRGPWISHIWVDSLPSLKGGREMWGMDKDLAHFDWRRGAATAVSVRDVTTSAVVAAFSWAEAGFRLPLPGWVRGIGSVHGDRRSFRGRGVSRLGVTSVDVHVPPASPFAGLGLHETRLWGLTGEMNLRFGDIRILAPAPPRTSALTASGAPAG